MIYPRYGRDLNESVKDEFRKIKPEVNIDNQDIGDLWKEVYGGTPSYL
jgi:hypothetical protein